MAENNVLEQYALRASFVSNRLKDLGYLGLIARARTIIDNMDSDLEWGSEYTIPSKSSAEVLEKKGLPVSLVFAHPSVLRVSPIMLKYYRCITAFPIKGLQRVSGVSNIKTKEISGSISDSQAYKLVTALNDHANLLFLKNEDVSMSKLDALFYASAGISIDGSWRNQIGAEGERATRKAIVERLIAVQEVKSFVLKNGQSVSGQPDLIIQLDENIDTIQSVQCINSSSIIFSSEPDLRFIAPDGRTVTGIEVKAGLDPAGALERLGAMIKSFDELKSSSPGADTILLASCITEEVQKRLNETKVVTLVMDLTDILTNKRNAADKLVTRIRKYLELLT